MRQLLRSQPIAVWAVGFAAIVSFMGLGSWWHEMGSCAVP
jgi:hypothetical protein